MDQIKEYIKNLFRGIPETPDVLRAKAELMEMMEDKYEQLLQEGKSPQEAFGTVVSEFGDLEELSEAMGISFSERTDDQTGRDADFRGFVNEKMPKNGYYANLEPHEIWDKDRTHGSEQCRIHGDDRGGRRVLHSGRPSVQAVWL